MPHVIVNRRHHPGRQVSQAAPTILFAEHMYAWDWPWAEREFKQALELNPGYAWGHLWYAQYLSAIGRFAEAIDEIKHAKDLDPLRSASMLMLGGCFTWLGSTKHPCSNWRRPLNWNHFRPRSFLRGREHRIMRTIAEVRLRQLRCPRPPRLSERGGPALDGTLVAVPQVPLRVEPLLAPHSPPNPEKNTPVHKPG